MKKHSLPNHNATIWIFAGLVVTFSLAFFYASSYLQGHLKQSYQAQTTQTGLIYDTIVNPDTNNIIRIPFATKGIQSTKPLEGFDVEFRDFDKTGISNIQFISGQFPQGWSVTHNTDNKIVIGGVSADGLTSDQTLFTLQFTVDQSFKARALDVIASIIVNNNTIDIPEGPIAVVPSWSTSNLEYEKQTDGSLDIFLTGLSSSQQINSTKLYIDQISDGITLSSITNGHNTNSWLQVPNLNATPAIFTNASSNAIGGSTLSRAHIATLTYTGTTTGNDLFTLLGQTTNPNNNDKQYLAPITLQKTPTNYYDTDINENGYTNFGDFVCLLRGWRSEEPGPIDPPRSDINKDASVQVKDFGLLLSDYTNEGPDQNDNPDNVCGVTS